MQSEVRLPKRVLILGGTGLIGSHLVSLAAKHPNVATVIAPVRQLPPQTHSGSASKVRWSKVDFARLEEHPSLFEIDVVLCALGTTLRKAGSRDAFETVDYQLPLTVARLAKQAGATRFGLVSSMKADPKSWFFYTRTKGRLEHELTSLGYSSLVFARPSLLLGARGERRFGEDVAKALLTPLQALVPLAFRPIEGFEVARKLLDFTLSAPTGVHILNNAELHR